MRAGSPADRAGRRSQRPGRHRSRWVRPGRESGKTQGTVGLPSHGAIDGERLGSLALDVAIGRSDQNDGIGPVESHCGGVPAPWRSGPGSAVRRSRPVGGHRPPDGRLGSVWTAAGRRGGGRRAGRAPASRPRSRSVDERVGDGRPIGTGWVRSGASRDADDRSVNWILFLLIANRNEPSSVEVLSRFDPPVEVRGQVVEIREQGRGMNPIPSEFGEQRRSIRLGDEDLVQGDDARTREVGER